MRGWKILAILGLAVALVAVALYAWIRAIESRRWKEMETTLESLEQEALSRPGERLVLYGEPIPGNAWTFYQRAQDFTKGKGRLTLVAEYAARMPKVDRDRAVEMIKDLAPAVEDLRKGARCGTAMRAIDWRTTGSQILPSQNLASLAVGQAREWAAGGRVRDAVELLLDSARMGADLGADAEIMGHMISMAAVSITFDEMKSLVADPAIGREDLLLLDSGLDRLDRSFPRAGPALVNGALAMGWELHLAPSVDAYVGKVCAQLMMKKLPVSTWRFAFSEQLLIAGWFQGELDRCRRLAATDDRPWTEASSAARTVDRELAESKNPLATLFNLWYRRDRHLALMTTTRDRRAQLRLLRIAARYRATGEILDLDDPFGGKLSRAEKDGRLKLWSVGRDGVDDGGRGEWHPRAGKDIVLEVNR